MHAHLAAYGLVDPEDPANNLELTLPVVSQHKVWLKADAFKKVS